MRALTLPTQGFAARYLTLFGGEVFSKLCVLVAFAYLARVLPAADYGVVETALSITVFFVLGVESGMGAYGARILASHPGQLPQLLPRIMLLRGLLGLPAIIAILAIAWFSQSAAPRLLLITGLSVLVTPFLTQWVFQGLRQMQWVAAGSIARNLVFVSAVLLLVRPAGDIRLVAAAEVAGICALALVNSYHLYVRLGVRLDRRGALAGTRHLFGDVWPLGLSDFAWASLWYAPVILTGWIAGPEQVAWIAAPIRIVMSVHTLVWLYFFNLLPDLAARMSESVDAWRDLMRRSLGVAMWPAGLIAIGGTLSAPIMIPLIFGAGFTQGIRPFQVVVWVIPVMWFSGHFRFSLIAAGRQRRELDALAAGAIVTAIGTLLLGRFLGGAGASVALLAGSGVNALLAAAYCRRHVGAPPDFRALMPWAAATLVALGAGAALSMMYGAAAGTVLGCAAYAAFGARHLGEIRALAGR